MAVRRAVNLKRPGRKGSIRKHYDMERYYVCVSIRGIEHRTICESLEMAEQWIDARVAGL